jgi:Ca-activated chloride channel family protein
MKLDSPTHATFVAKNGQIVPLRSVHVEGDYVGLLSIMTITQVYQNPTDQALEVMYTFPLAHDATLLDVTIQIRGKTFKSAVFPEYDGQQEYDKAIRKGNTAIIIERAGEFYMLKLGKLPSGEEVKIGYRYGQFIMPHDGRVRVAIPTTIAPQYGNPQDSGIAPDQAPVTSLTVSYPFSALIRFHGIAHARINVVSHIAQMSMHGNNCHVAINGATMDRDVVMHVNAFEQAYISLYTPHAGQHWYASYVHLPAAQLKNVAPMHIKLLVDCSGSMGGSSIRQAQQAVMRLLGLLRDGDSIAVTRFGSNVVDVTPGLMRVGPVIRSQMNNWVKTIEANLGGTAIGGALEHVLRMPTNKQDCVIIVLTDGEAYGITQVATLARQQAHRIFPLVIGYTPNDGELNALADITGGFSESVTPNERIEDAIERTINKIRFTPVHNTAIDFGDAVVAWQTGKPVRYAGAQGLIWSVTDRYTHPTWHHDDTTTPLELINVDESVCADFVRMMAAKHLINLTGTYQTEWAMKYQLISDETVFVAVAVHEADAKVHDEQIRVLVTQEMAFDAHKSILEYSSSRRGATYHLMMPPQFRSRSGIRYNSIPDIDFDTTPTVSMMRSSPVIQSNTVDAESYTSIDFTVYEPGLTTLLAHHNNDITKLTLASLVGIGFSQDQIDACAQITGYTEQQIVNAIVALILPEKAVKRLGIFVNTIPSALTGGLRIVLATS